MRRCLLIASLLMLTCPGLAHAADQTVLGSLLILKNPSTPDKRKVVLKAKEDTTDNTIVGDPTANGATLTLTAYGTSATTQTFTLPAGNWTGNATDGFKYKDSDGTNGPLKKVLMKVKNGTFQIKAVALGKLGTISVLPPNTGSAGCAELDITGGDTYGLRFSDGMMSNKGPKQFKASHPTTQGTCSPTCGNGLVDPGEECDPNGLTCGGAACNPDCTCPCDFLDPAVCMFPFPSDFLTVADPTTDTGRRVHFSNAGMPRNGSAVPIESSDYNLNDGFSQGASMLVRVPNVDLAMTGAPPITDVESSLDSDSPVVVVNATTLAHHLIWAEIDSNATSEPQRSVEIHPAVNLDEGQRYIVALRKMKDPSGAIIAPNADFLAYRDNTPLTDPVKEARRPHMEEIFATLADAGVLRDDLYIAWDFTVASQRNITERLLSIRDDAFTRLGSAAPPFTVTMVENDLNSKIYRRVTGTFKVERYVDSSSAPARFVLDANGLPIHQASVSDPDPQVASFICNIPRIALPTGTAAATAGRASLYGHGLLGSNDEVSSGNVQDMANEHNFVFCATKWIGMSDEDVVNAVGILLNFSNFPTLTDRLQQSMVNQLYLARLMIHPDGFVSDPAFQDSFANPVIDTSDVFYDGNSQGGIFGGTLMTVAQDITRGVLGVPGMNYSLLLPRSSDFDDYKPFFYPSYTPEINRPLILGLVQMLWDRSDPNGYIRHLKNDPLPGTPSHDVLLHLAFGDHQVANVSTEIEARTMGINIHQPAIAAGRHTDVNPYSGIPAIPSYPFNGSALVVWDNAGPAPPTTNTAPTAGADPHSKPRSSAVARNQKSDFLQTGGSVTDVCSGAPCVAP